MDIYTSEDDHKEDYVFPECVYVRDSQLKFHRFVTELTPIIIHLRPTQEELVILAGLDMPYGLYSTARKCMKIGKRIPDICTSCFLEFAFDDDPCHWCLTKSSY